MKKLCCRNQQSTTRGYSMIEVLVAIAITIIAVPALVGGILSYLRSAFDTMENVQAVYLLEEGIEIARFLRDKGWSTTTASYITDTPYYLATSSAGWIATTTPQQIDNRFIRTLTFSDVYRRDSDSDIVAQSDPDPKSLDPDIRKLTVTVSWSTESTSTMRMSTYLANIYDE